MSGVERSSSRNRRLYSTFLDAAFPKRRFGNQQFAGRFQQSETLKSDPASPQLLEAGAVAVSFTRLGEIDLARAPALLSEAEIERTNRITCEDYRRQVVKARALLRLMLAQCTGSPPQSFEFDEGGGTRPRLRVNPWGLHFSVSHSDDQVAIAISTAPIGMDVERVAADCNWQDIAALCFHPRESERLQSGNAAADHMTFFEIWTRKEAYLKGVGTPLATEPASFSTATESSAVSTESADPAAHGWYTRLIEAPSGYKAALATTWPQPRLIHLHADSALGESASLARPEPDRQERLVPAC